MTWVSIGIAGGQALLGSITGRKERKRQRQLEQAAQRAEEERQQRVAYYRALVDSIYDSPARQRQYDDYLAAMRGQYQEDVAQQYADAARGQKFRLARRGLTGGSAAIDASRRLGERYQRAGLEAESRAQASLADLIAGDEATRLSLIRLAEGGNDVTADARRAAMALRGRTMGDLVGVIPAGLGDVFADSAKAYRTQQRRAASGREELYG